MKKLNNSIVIYTILIIIIGFIVYYPSLHNKFIWDDEAQIVNNPYIRSLKNIPAILTGGTFYLKAAGDNLQGVYYRPLMTLTYTAIYHFFGLNPLPYHALQLLIHILNTILLFILLMRLIKWKNHLTPFLLSLLFLIHPMNSETVSYIANVQDVLMFLFGILALHTIIHIKKPLANLLLSGVLLFLSLLSKETAMVFIGIALIYLYLFQRKYFKMYLLTYVGIMICYSLIRCNIANICVTAHKPNPIGDLPFLQYLIQLPALAFYYIKSFIFPVNLSIGQSWVIDKADMKSFYLPFIALIILISGIIYFLFRLYIEKQPLKKIYVFFTSSFFLSLGFHLHAIPLDFTVADRWFYIPMNALIGMIATILSIYSISKNRRYVISILLIFIIIIFSIVTHRRNYDWKDNYTLFSRDVNKTPNSFHLENNLGVELYRKGRYEEAQIHFEKAVRYSPEWHSALTNLGVMYHRKKQYKKAEVLYLKAIEYDAFYKTYINYISLLEAQGRYKEAIQFIEKKALKKFPENNRLREIYTDLKQKVTKSSQ